MKRPQRSWTLARTWSATLFGSLLVVVFAACGPTTPRDDHGHDGAPRVRIVPTNAAAVDYVLDLVGTDRIAALPETVIEFTNTEVDLSVFGPDRRFKDFKAEVVLGYDPDLVIASPWQGQDAIDRLRDAGVEVIELTAIQSLEDVRTTMTRLGVALDAEERAVELLADFDRRVQDLKSAAEARPAGRGISYLNYGSGGWVAGKGTTADLILELVGLQNVAAREGRRGHDTLDIETLLTWDPDWVVVSKPSETYGATRSFLESEAVLKGLRCLQQGHIAEVPADLFSTTSHYIVRAAEALAAELTDIANDEQPTEGQPTDRSASSGS